MREAFVVSGWMFTRWRTFVVAAGLVFCCLFSGSSALAATTTISAHISGVRLILLNKQGVISEVQSNTPDNVPPQVFQTDYRHPVPLSPLVRLQYDTIVSRANWNQRTGVVYRLQPAKPRATNVLRTLLAVVVLPPHLLI